MKKLPLALLPLLLVISLAAAMQNQNSSSNSNGSSSSKAKSNSNAKKRGPIFRATGDQIKQAQGILKDRGFYAGEQTGKLDTGTRTGLKQYQQAETLKVTGTLNKVTLEKMGITLTEKQKQM